jgi:hypothetical protein
MSSSLPTRAWGPLALAATLLAGCTAAPLPPTPAPPTPVAYTEPVDRVWEAALSVLSESEFTIGSLERGSGFIRTAELVVPARGRIGEHYISWVANCGRSGSGTPRTFGGTTFVAVTLLLEPSGDGTTARIRSSMHNQTSTENRVFTNACTSSGLLEQTIAARIAERLRA